MKFGVSITFSLGLGAPVAEQGAYTQELARVIEGSGIDSVWVADRTVYPPDLAKLHPERWGPDGEDVRGQNVLEPVTTLGFIAGGTRTVKLGFSVMVLPFRHPVLNAKMVTTLDVLSGGRVMFGVGVGWMPEEFEGMGADFSARGRVTDEHLELFKALCTEEVAAYAGQHFQISGKTFFPKPLQEPHPPIWVGGGTSAAIRRTARFGDGWLPTKLSLAEFESGLQRLRQRCAEGGRRQGSVVAGLAHPLFLGTPRPAVPQSTDQGGRQPLSGAPSEIIDDIRRYRDAGLEYLVVSIASADRNYTVESIKRFAGEVAGAL